MQSNPSSLSQLQPIIQARDSMAEAGRIILDFHFQRMLQNEAGTRLGADTEALHDMRVAIRRMRAAFRIFKPYYDDEVIKPHREGLKVTGRILGTVRDWDVLFEKTRIYADSLSPEEQSKLKFLLDSWFHEREYAREQLLVYLDSEAYRNFKYAFSEFVHAPGDELLEFPPQNWVVCNDAPSLIFSQYEQVLAHETDLQNPTVQQLHALRIDFKRLRYTVEFFRAVLGDTVDYCIEELKLLQDYLGDLNDTRVAIRRIQDFLLSQGGNLVAEISVEKYYQAKEAELDRMVTAFPQAWSRFRQPEFRQKLDESLKTLRYPI